MTADEGTTMNKSILLVLAVVVGSGTAFGVHRYLEGGGSPRLGLIDRITGGSDASVSERPSLEAIRKTSEELSQLAARREFGKVSLRAADLLVGLDQAYTVLAEELRGDEAQLSELRIATLHAKYAAVRIDRDWFAEPFLEFADQLIAEQPTGGDADQAAVLRLVVRHDLRRPATSDVINDLDRFANSHSQVLGAIAFRLVAQELAHNEHPQSAEAVLRHGLRTYRSTPVAGTLVNELVELGLSKAPPAGITPFGLQALERCYGSKAAAGRKKASGSESKSRSTS
jgi:hypothetical protein